MFSLMGSPHIFLNLFNQPRGRMMMEMYCGLLLFINSNLILLQLMLRISLTLQASIFCRLSACSADLRGFQSPGTACLFSAAITVCFPGLLQKIKSLTQLLPCQSLSQILDPSLRFVDPLKFLILLKYFCLILCPQNIELTSCQFNLLMNLNYLLKPSIILAGERRNQCPGKKRIRLSLIACRETLAASGFTKIKHKADGSIERYKARLVAKGFR
uniref:hypothetical protein n=1 Tax=Jatropha curcas TaxID=180498 RepID=UPI0027A720FD|nr:hypothetical protein QLP06_mgp018 [Jatropha curcas]WFG81221.1 hypothetical protein [Jatropha curcas]